jgi:hypothetical protein
MNLYTILSSGLGTHEATALGTRLSAWHDAMVAHERRLRAGTTSDACDDECPHAQARELWSEAVAAFGVRAQELTFLRSRAQTTRRSLNTTGSARPRAEAADHARPRPPDPRPDRVSPVASAMVETER